MGPRGIPKYLSVEIKLSFNRISFIQQHSFLGAKFISGLYLQNNDLTSIHDYTFEGLDHVSEIDLSFNKISVIDGFGNLSKLEVLHLSNNSLTEIHNFTFKYLYSLKKLFLARNNIVTISTSTFVFKKLEILQLQMNSIASLSWDVFHIEKSLFLTDSTDNYITLDLSHNEINKTTEHCWIKQGIETQWIQTDNKSKELWENKNESYCPNLGTPYLFTSYVGYRQYVHKPPLQQSCLSWQRGAREARTICHI